MKEIRCFNLPNNKTTRSQKCCLDTWKRLATQIEKATGYRCFAFDPRLDFVDDKSSQSLSTAFAIKLYEALANKTYK